MYLFNGILTLICEVVKEIRAIRSYVVFSTATLCNTFLFLIWANVYKILNTHRFLNMETVYSKPCFIYFHAFVFPVKYYFEFNLC
jgi:hypothetical protein